MLPYNEHDLEGQEELIVSCHSSFNVAAPCSETRIMETRMFRIHAGTINTLQSLSQHHLFNLDDGRDHHRLRLPIIT